MLDRIIVGKYTQSSSKVLVHTAKFRFLQASIHSLEGDQ